ncbi:MULTISPECIES: DUF4034 domain-containing protein [unclassified Kitasatospora]|uniref:DUF4034 domain-containing protein n=1 Tax=unclassified Kitasatospora TaxID=2633591 RepID=UPI00070E8603|nr:MULTISPECIES: DUF4034 domain-containing protein [unclassified Kitasatospora]KQV23948.1 hypothetical protein ASC99_01695 [Kitasatospora sp. Root107]KRB67339.1 hypothetical protein ASE03_03040 [Kitasatospora sp. Root187]
MLFLTIAVGALLFTLFKSLKAKRAAAVSHAEVLSDPARASQFGLVPNQGLVLGRTTVDDDARIALSAVRDGSWREAAAYIDAAGTDWDERWERTELFVNPACNDDSWLNTWRMEQPDNSDAASLHVVALVHAGWAIRGSGYSNTVTDEMWAGFRQKLQQATEAAAEAVRLAPAADPSPYLAQLALARGDNWSNDHFEMFWAKAVKRAPLNRDAHWQAMQYWCRKWHGSNELMHAFVDEAIAAAPAGSLFSTLKLDAYGEQFDDAETRTSPALRAAVDAVLADIAAARPDHPELPAARGRAVRFLAGQGRHAEALTQFQALGPVIPAPFLGDPDEFVELRARTVVALSR